MLKLGLTLGGSLIGTQTILTAAHCVDGATHGTIVLGAHFLTNQAEPNQRRIAVPGSAVVMHPDWNPLLIRDDVALVRLGGPAPLIPGVKWKHLNLHSNDCLNCFNQEPFKPQFCQQ